MDDLISILRDMAAGRRNKVGDFWGIHYCTEAADALEAAQEDAERYRWIRSSHRTTAELEIVLNHQGGVLDATIDAAREARNG